MSEFIRPLEAKWKQRFGKVTGSSMGFLDVIRGVLGSKSQVPQTLRGSDNQVTAQAPVSSDWCMPKFKGRDICDWVEDINGMKRDGDLIGALEVAQGCMASMVQAAKVNPSNVMEFYVIQVVTIQHRVKDYEGELETLEYWLSLGLPPARQDHRLNLEKRRAKAYEIIAKRNGEDATAYAAEWRRFVELEKLAKSAPHETTTSTGRSLANPDLACGRSSNRRSGRSGWTAPLTVLESQTFVAVDFETANSQGGVSACQIALVKVEDGRVVDRFTTLIKPPAGFDAFEFTYLHGISARHVRKSPSWPDIAAVIDHFVSGLPVYAHNASFDSKVWRDLDDYFGTNTRPTVFYCSYRTAQHLVPGLENYKLPTVVQALVPGYQLNHHEAGSDAEACALIVSALQRSFC